MGIPIKTEQQLDIMRQAGKLVAEVLALMRESISAGISTKELDRIAEDFITKSGGAPSFKGYNGFPASACISINEVILHGIPGLRRLKSGDIVSIDIGICYEGYHADAARTFAVGEISPEASRLIETTKASFFDCLRHARDGSRLHEISASIQDFVEARGHNVAKDFVGHGIGRKLHEPPQIPIFRQKTRGPRLAKGMVLAIEPMVTQGGDTIDILEDGWTAATRDGMLAAHYENTVVITDTEPEIITFFQDS